MALSNWDCVAWNEKGEICDGRLLTPDGVIVEIHKNVIYVKDKSSFESWDNDCKAFRYPHVLEVSKGNLAYKNIKIYSVNGKQNSIYTVVIYNDYKENKVLCLYGIGCYGYKGDEWVGVEKETIEDFFRWLNNLTKRMYIPLPEKFNKPKRFNQGDRVFADCIGFDIPYTNPEEAEEPILKKILKDF